MGRHLLAAALALGVIAAATAQDAEWVREAASILPELPGSDQYFGLYAGNRNTGSLRVSVRQEGNAYVFRATRTLHFGGPGDETSEVLLVGPDFAVLGYVLDRSTPTSRGTLRRRLALEDGGAAGFRWRERVVYPEAGTPAADTTWPAGPVPPGTLTMPVALLVLGAMDWTRTVSRSFQILDGETGSLGPAVADVSGLNDEPIRGVVMPSLELGILLGTVAPSDEGARLVYRLRVAGGRTLAAFDTRDALSYVQGTPVEALSDLPAADPDHGDAELRATAMTLLRAYLAGDADALAQLVDMAELHRRAVMAGFVERGTEVQPFSRSVLAAATSAPEGVPHPGTPDFEATLRSMDEQLVLSRVGDGGTVGPPDADLIYSAMTFHRASDGAWRLVWWWNLLP